MFIGVTGQKIKIVNIWEVVIEELLENDDYDIQKSEFLQQFQTLDHKLEKISKDIKV